MTGVCGIYLTDFFIVLVSFYISWLCLRVGGHLVDICFIWVSEEDCMGIKDLGIGGGFDLTLLWENPLGEFV